MMQDTGIDVVSVIRKNVPEPQCSGSIAEINARQDYLMKLQRQIEWLEANSVLRNPRQHPISEYLETKDEPEPVCPGSERGFHSEAWYDGERCSICCTPALATPPPKSEQVLERVARHMTENTEPMDAESERLLYENLSDLYDTDDAPHTPQAHADALAALRFLINSSTADHQALRNADEAIRPYLTTSGVPDAVRRLPEELRQDANNSTIIGDPKDIYRWFADELESALASAPAAGVDKAP